MDRADTREGVYTSNINGANEVETEGSKKADFDIDDSRADAGPGANAAREGAPDDSLNVP